MENFAEIPIKLSICIPQFNRIKFLLKSLELISLQNYPNLEIAISDDGSTDDTEIRIAELKTHYKFPIIFVKNEVNLGYDRNYRKCIEIASGQYVIVIGNDDTINPEFKIENIVTFLIENNFPDIGYCNMIEQGNGNSFIQRALATQILGTGADIALKYYSCFSFVGGLIYKRESFLKYNSSKFDGSIYAQTYLGVKMVSSGCVLFSIKDPVVIKDLTFDRKISNSYRDTITKKWKNFKIVDGGLPSVINVVINALHDVEEDRQNRIYFIFRRMYAITFPYWIIDYKQNGAFPEAIGLIAGLWPAANKNFKKLNITNKILIYGIYTFSSLLAIATPVFLFKKLKSKLYSYFKQ